MNPAGAAGMLIGSASALLCVNTDVFTGPIAGALDGADLSAFTGTILGAVMYAAVTVFQRSRRTDPAPTITAVNAPAMALS